MNDPYLNTEMACKRLMDRWRAHKSLIVAVDFDDTVHDLHESGHQFPRVGNLLTECQNLGFKIVMFSVSSEKRFPYIKDHMRELYGLEDVPVNADVVELPFGQCRKIFFNILLDDRAGLGQAVEILEKTIAMIKAEQEANVES